MNTFKAIVRAAADAVVGAVHVAVDGAGAARRRHADARARAICPVDSWAFTPLHTDGACPLCGWVPEGYVYSTPLLTPYQRYWGAMGGIAVVSAVMCVVVVVAALAKS